MKAEIGISWLSFSFFPGKRALTEIAVWDYWKCLFYMAWCDRVL